MDELNLLRKRLLEDNLDFFELMELKDEILQLERKLGISSEPPPGSNYQCEGCGS
jgi:hypothetical protein